MPDETPVGEPQQPHEPLDAAINGHHTETTPAPYPQPIAPDDARDGTIDRLSPLPVAPDEPSRNEAETDAEPPVPGDGEREATEAPPGTVAVQGATPSDLAAAPLAAVAAMPPDRGEPFDPDADEATTLDTVETSEPDADGVMTPDRMEAFEPDAEIATLDTAAGAPQPVAAAPARRSTPALVAALRRDWQSWLPITAILILAAFLRLRNLLWDEGVILHPDENGTLGIVLNLHVPQSLSDIFSPTSSLNPHFSAYGHLPFYIIAIWTHLLSAIGHLGGPFAPLLPAMQTTPNVVVSARALSSLFDTGTLFFVYLIGQRLYSRGTGLLAALLGCFTVLNLEFSHFAMFDPDQAFFVLGALYVCTRIVREGRASDYAWAGVWVALATACKINGAALLAPLVVAHAFRGAQGAPLFVGEATAAVRRLTPNPLLLLLSVVCAALTFAVVMPYALIDFSNWWPGVWSQLQLAQGQTDVPYTRKFGGTPAYWYPLQQMLWYTLGLPLGLSAVVGTAAALWRQVSRRRAGEMVLLTWALVFFASTGGQYMKFLRYMLPLTPVLTLFAAALLVGLWRARPRLATRTVVLVVVALSLLYGVAYENMFSAENPRFAATRWLAANVPVGTIFTTEDWDETLPIAPPSLSLPPYQPQQLPILGGPSTDPVAMTAPLVNALQTAQYITIASERDLGSVAHQPGRYPYAIQWYRLLFEGKLNFKLYKSFANHPHLGPFTLNDYQPVPPSPTQFSGFHLWYPTDQNMSEYDHPPVYIFKRTGSIAPAHALALLTDNGTLRVPTVAYSPAQPMLLPPAVERADQTAPTYNQIFPPDNPLARAPLLSWWVMIELLGLLALPLVLRAGAGRLRDGGYALAKVGGIVVVGFVTWLAASLHIAVYSRSLILASCALLLLLSLTLGLRPAALWATLRRGGRGVITAEVLFIGAFLVMAAIRAAYPDLWHMTYGGERTQELSFTNAILRSQYFPPADPWFAGGSLNYYYYGQYLMGMLMKLSGIATPIGFNLALPTLWALLLSVAFSIGYNATARLWVGAVAAALEGVLGNLGMVQQFANLAPSSGTLDLPLLSGLWNAVNGIVAVAITHTVPLPPDFFWGSSRVVTANSVIDEFPIWSFTYGDMHAHVIDEPILMTVIALALAVSGLGRIHIPGLSPGRNDTAATRARSGIAPLQWVALFLLMAVVAGATGPTNLWDLPTSLVILVAGFGLRGWFEARRRGWALVLRDLALPGAILGGLCLALYRPFYTTVFGISSGFTFVAPFTPTHEYLLHLGLPLFLLVSFVLSYLARRSGRTLSVLEFYLYYFDRRERLPRLFNVAAAIIGPQQRPDRGPLTLLSLHIALLGALAVFVTAFVFSFATLTLIAMLLTLCLVAFVEVCARSTPEERRAAQAFALALAVMGLGLTALPDLIQQNEAGIMNTFFKLYNQAWPLLALSGALSMAALVQAWRRPVAATAALPLPQSSPVSSRRIPALGSAFAAPSLALAGAGALRGGGTGPSVRALSSYDAPEEHAVPPLERHSEQQHLTDRLRALPEGTPPPSGLPEDGRPERVEGNDGQSQPVVTEPVLEAGDTAALSTPTLTVDKGEQSPASTVAPPEGEAPQAAVHEPALSAEAQSVTPASEPSVEVRYLGASQRHAADDAMARDAGPWPMASEAETEREGEGTVAEGLDAPVVSEGVPGVVPPEPVTAALGGNAVVAVGIAPLRRPRLSPEQGAWWVVAAVLILGGLLYPAFGVYSHLQIRHIWPQLAVANAPTGLDGSAFMRTLYPADSAAIDWIDGHIHGMPVLLTSERGGYRDFAAKVTMFTGLPTVISWDGEDGQERYNGQSRPGSQFPNNWFTQLPSGATTWNGSRWVNNIPQAGAPPSTGSRVSDVETIYNTPDPTVALPLLRAYHVGLIYVGTAEHGDSDSDEPGRFGHAGFDLIGLAKFDRMVTAHQLSVLYDRDGVKIYRVL